MATGPKTPGPASPLGTSSTASGSLSLAAGSEAKSSGYPVTRAGGPSASYPASGYPTTQAGGLMSKPGDSPTHRRVSGMGTEGGRSYVQRGAYGNQPPSNAFGQFNSNTNRSTGGSPLGSAGNRYGSVASGPASQSPPHYGSGGTSPSRVRGSFPAATDFGSRTAQQIRSPSTNPPQYPSTSTPDPIPGFGANSTTVSTSRQDSSLSTRPSTPLPSAGTTSPNSAPAYRTARQDGPSNRSQTAPDPGTGLGRGLPSQPLAGGRPHTAGAEIPNPSMPGYPTGGTSASANRQNSLSSRSPFPVAGSAAQASYPATNPQAVPPSYNRYPATPNGAGGTSFSLPATSGNGVSQGVSGSGSVNGQPRYRPGGTGDYRPRASWRGGQ